MTPTTFEKAFSRGAIIMGIRVVVGAGGPPISLAQVWHWQK
jgi:hypothetical protein